MFPVGCLQTMSATISLRCIVDWQFVDAVIFCLYVWILVEANHFIPEKCNVLRSTVNWKRNKIVYLKLQLWQRKICARILSRSSGASQASWRNSCAGRISLSLSISFLIGRCSNSMFTDCFDTWSRWWLAVSCVVTLCLVDAVKLHSPHWKPPISSLPWCFMCRSMFHL